MNGSGDVTSRYLEAFSVRARAAGLNVKKPGQNWIAARDIVPGSHVSLSVRRDQIQVDLNNERDEDRRRLNALYRDRAAIAEAVGSSLNWEQKDGRKKTAVRATYPAGPADEASWQAQQEWAIRTMLAFEREFGRRLQGLSR